MGTLAKFVQVKDVIEPGEELLYQSYKLVSNPDKSVDILAAIDGGSTQTRGILMDHNDLGNYDEALSDVFVIPSTSIPVLGDPTVVPVSERLADGMDSSILNLDTVQNPFIDRVRLVRGSKALNVEGTEQRIGSSTQKTLDPTYYYNLLDLLGYGVIRKYSGDIPAKVRVSLCASLPPDDTIDVNVAKFKSNLKKYNWTHTDSGISIEFEFVNIAVMTEPEAEIKAYYTLNDEEIPEVVFHINGGGRSIGEEILKNGVSVKGAQKTLDFGATQLLDLIGSIYLNKVGGRPPRREALERAVRTGKLKVGNELRNIPEIVIQAKEEMGKRVFVESKTKVFDAQDKIVPTDVNVASVSGRFFDQGRYVTEEGTELWKRFHNASVPAYFSKDFATEADKAAFEEQLDLPYTMDNNLVFGFSVAQTFFENYNSISEFTDILHFAESYIPQGLLINGINKFFTNDQIIAAIEKAEAQAEAASAQEDEAQAGDTLSTEEEAPLNTFGSEEV